MNGFTLMSDSYRKLIEQGKITEADAKRDIEIYDFLATCDKDDFYRMVDSSAFNEVIECYVQEALKGAGVNEKTADKVMSEIKWLFDERPAKEVCEPCATRARGRRQ